MSFHGHSGESLELAFVSFQLYLVTFYVRTSIQANNSYNLMVFIGFGFYQLLVCHCQSYVIFGMLSYVLWYVIKLCYFSQRRHNVRFDHTTLQPDDKVFNTS